MDTTPLREIKPVVVPGQYYTMAPLISGFIAIFPGVFTFILSNIIAMQTGDPFERLHQGPVLIYAVIVYLIAFCVSMALLWVKAFQEPARTTYSIYADRVEYSEGLWTRHRRTILFDQVIDVELIEGMFQQAQNAGTVTLVTQQLITGPNNQIANRRFAIQNIPQPREVYDLLRELALKKRTN